jgi:hypothetical protein
MAPSWSGPAGLATPLPPPDANTVSGRRDLTTEVPSSLRPQRAIHGNCLPSHGGRHTLIGVAKGQVCATALFSWWTQH